MSIRLNKLLARRGVGARRKCDLLIQQGRVRVNGQIVREPGTQVEPDRDRIEVGGKSLPPAAEHRYYVLNKPVGVISTLDDPEGRRTLREFLPPGPRLFPVGRLDADTSGLLMITNDGELAHRLMHPRYGVEKVYRVWLDRAPSAVQLARLQDGVEFEPGIVSEPARVRPLTAPGGRGLIELTIHEGRYRQVRRMCEAVGLNVTGLHRWAYGPVRLGTIERGMWRELSGNEVAELRAASSRPRRRSRPASREFFSARRGLVRDRREPSAARGPRRAPPRPSRAGESRSPGMPKRFERRPRAEARTQPLRFERRPRTEARTEPRRFERRPRTEARAEPRRFERRPRAEARTEPLRFERRPRPEARTEPRRFERRPRAEARTQPLRLERRPRTEARTEPRRFERRPRPGARVEPGRFERRPRRPSDEGQRRFDRTRRSERPRRDPIRPGERPRRTATRRREPDGERPRGPERGRRPVGRMPRGSANRRKPGRASSRPRPRRGP